MNRTLIEPPLTVEEEAALSRTIEAGVLAGRLLTTGERPVPATEAELQALVDAGEQAFQRFLLSYVRLAGKLAAAEARRCGLGLEDLFQEGCLALAETLQRYDYRVGRFSTYATVRVRQRLAEAGAGRLGDLAIPTSRALRLRRARGAVATLGQELQRTVGASEIAPAIGTSAREARHLLTYRAPTSIEAVADGVADPSPIDPDAGILAGQFRRLLSRLNADQAAVIRLRFGIDGQTPLPPVQAAATMGLSISSVRRLERTALAQLRLWLSDTGGLSAVGQCFPGPPARWSA